MTEQGADPILGLVEMRDAIVELAECIEDNKTIRTLAEGQKTADTLARIKRTVGGLYR